jgi:hypothetical protein
MGDAAEEHVSSTRPCDQLVSLGKDVTPRGGYKAQLDRTVEPIVMMSLHHHMKPCSNGT